MNQWAVITQQSDVDNLQGGRYIFQDADIGLGFVASGIIYVTNQGSFKTQIAITYSLAHPNEIYSRTFHTSRNPQWTSWSRNDNYGTTSLSELASALGVPNRIYYSYITCEAGVPYDIDIASGFLIIAPTTSASAVGLYVKTYTAITTINNGHEGWFTITVSPSYHVRITSISNLTYHVWYFKAM